MSFTVFNTTMGNIPLYRYYAVKESNPMELLKGFDDINDCKEYCKNTNCVIYDMVLKEIRNDIH